MTLRVKKKYLQKYHLHVQFYNFFSEFNELETVRVQVQVISTENLANARIVIPRSQDLESSRIREPRNTEIRKRFSGKGTTAKDRKRTIGIRQIAKDIS